MAVQVDSLPKGNWVARRLRLVNNDSKQLFPSTPAEVRASKYSSMYREDYHMYPVEVFLAGLEPKGQQMVRETIRDVMFGQSPSSVFANGTVPPRVAGQAETTPRDSGDVALPNKGDTSRLSRQATLPAIRPVTVTPKLRGTTHEAVPFYTRALRRARSTLNLPVSKSMAHEELRGQWTSRLPDVDRKLLDKVLRLQAEGQGGAGQAVRGSVLPDARGTVERWLEGATEAERQVALQFFGSLAGSRLVGQDGEEQSGRLRDIISALQRPNKRCVAEGNLSPRAGAYASSAPTQGRHLRYIHLLDDDTRCQRWMHTTWHHLPDYPTTNPVANVSSHYLLPHRPQHRHFVIHPDWPPS